MIQVIFDPATGEILRRSTSHTPQDREGEGLIFVERGTIVDDRTMMVDLATLTLTDKP